MFILRCCFLILLLVNFKGYSLNFSDFSDENGQLLEISDPPFFDYPTFEHLDDYRSFDGYNPYYLIEKKAYNGLKDAIKAGIYILKIPPPYYWDENDKTIGFKERWMNRWRCRFFDRHSRQYVKERGTGFGGELEYSEYSLKYDYLYYWFDLCYNLEARSLEKQIQKKEEEIKRAEERHFKESYISGLRSDLTYLTKQLANLSDYRQGTFYSLQKSFNKITKLFLIVYEDYLNNQPNPSVVYERGRILYDSGDTIGFLADINALIANGFTPTNEIIFQIGKAYNNASQYNQAIRILSQAIEKDPGNKEAYFERALSYFETGRFDFALSDYIYSEFHPTLIDPNNERHFQYLKLSKGLFTGILKGGVDSTVDFVPSLFSTIYGIGKGLWVFSSDPVGVSVEMVSSCIGCIEFIKENLSIELIAALVPELRECIEKWDNLEEEKKGYYIGYVIGRYGVDMLAWGGSMRAIKLFRDLRRANTILTFENSYLSSKNLQEILAASEEFHQYRSSYIAKCKLDIGNQRKHIPGSNNYKEKTSDLLISLSELEAETKPKMGMGLPARGKFGKHGYQEFVEYDKVIGVFYTQEGKVLPTKCAKIHYNKKGEYHVVPSHPDIFKFKRDGG